MFCGFCFQIGTRPSNVSIITYDTCTATLFVCLKSNASYLFSSVLRTVKKAKVKWKWSYLVATFTLAWRPNLPLAGIRVPSPATSREKHWLKCDMDGTRAGKEERPSLLRGACEQCDNAHRSPADISDCVCGWALLDKNGKRNQIHFRLSII